jgi:CTP synthase (UTP-ammonia lyase)
MILEFARNVVGFADASHAEYDPGASRLFINPLSCTVMGMELGVRLRPQTIARRLYGTDEAIALLSGRSAVGRATVGLLKMNNADRRRLRER